MQTPQDETEQMIANCIKREGKLTDWERNFIDSLDVRIGKGSGITERQQQILEQIWESVT